MTKIARSHIILLGVGYVV
jgi:hypothetical protein